MAPSSELPAVGAVSLATAAPLLGHLSGAPWWLTVALAASVTVLGVTYLVTQTWLALEKLRQPTREPEPAAVAVLRTLASDDEPTRLRGEP